MKCAVRYQEFETAQTWRIGRTSILDHDLQCCDQIDKRKLDRCTRTALGQTRGTRLGTDPRLPADLEQTECKGQIWGRPEGPDLEQTPDYPADLEQTECRGQIWGRPEGPDLEQTSLEYGACDI
jgi:hypothetical protein